MNEQKKVDKAKQENENQELEMTRCFRRARSSSITTNVENLIPVATPPRKFHRFGRTALTLSEEEQENIW